MPSGCHALRPDAVVADWAAAGPGYDGPPGALAWRAVLNPGSSSSGAFTVTASWGNATATLERVRYGDVFFCSGQSNAALPVVYVTRSGERARHLRARPLSSLRCAG